MPFEASRELAEAKAELQKWRTGELRFKRARDEDDGTSDDRVVRQNQDPALLYSVLHRKMCSWL